MADPSCFGLYLPRHATKGLRRASLACRFFAVAALYRRARRGVVRRRVAVCSAREMPRQLAASSTDRPAKNRSSTRRLDWVFHLELGECLVQGEHVLGRSRCRASTASSGSRRRPPPCFNRSLRVLDEDAPHGLGRGGEEMAAAVPIAARPHRPDAGLLRAPAQCASVSGPAALAPVSCAAPGGAGRHRPTGRSWLAASASPCSMADRMRLISLMMGQHLGTTFSPSIIPVFCFCYRAAYEPQQGTETSPPGPAGDSGCGSRQAKGSFPT